MFNIHRLKMYLKINRANLMMSIVTIVVVIGTWFIFCPISNSRLGRTTSNSGVERTTSNSDWLRERLNESELIWRAGVTKRHEIEISKPFILKNPFQGQSLLIIWDLFYPTFNCPYQNERIGRSGDGGKWVCGVSHLAKRAESCLVYSYGIADDSSFEEEILMRTSCYIRAFDHTVSREHVTLVNRYPSRSSFDQVGLGSENKKNVRTLKSEMELHGDKFIDILKMDVEGGEFKLLPQILKDFPDGLPFGQLLIEIHVGALPQNNLYAELKSWWESLENAGLRPFHNEPNFYILYMGALHPSCFEVSFLNLKVNHTLVRS